MSSLKDLSSLPADADAVRSTFIEQGQKIYDEQLKDLLEPHQTGKFVAIEPITGRHFLGDSGVAALVAARAAMPAQTFYLMRVGHRGRTESGDMPQESGSVTAALEASLPVRLAGEVVECIVDTGFSGQLLLPRALADRLRLAIVGHEIFEMVGSHLLAADIALVEIEWLAQPRIVEVIISEGTDTLIGAELFAGARLTIDYAAGTVTLQT